MKILPLNEVATEAAERLRLAAQDPSFENAQNEIIGPDPVVNVQSPALALGILQALIEGISGCSKVNMSDKDRSTLMVTSADICDYIASKYNEAKGVL